MTLEHPYRAIYLDQQLRGKHRAPRRRRKPQAYFRVSLRERILDLAVIVGVFASLLLALALLFGLAWLVGMVIGEVLRGWRA